MRETAIHSYLITSEWLYFAATCSAVTNSPFDDVLSGSAPSKQIRTFEWIRMAPGGESWNACDPHQLARRMVAKDLSSPSQHDVNIYTTRFDGSKKPSVTIQTPRWMVTKGLHHHPGYFGWSQKTFRDHLNTETATETDVDHMRFYSPPEVMRTDVVITYNYTRIRSTVQTISIDHGNTLNKSAFQ